MADDLELTSDEYSLALVVFFSKILQFSAISNLIIC